MRSIYLVCVLFLVVCVPTVCAELSKEEKLLFDEKGSYDIYYQVNSKLANVVENAQIVDVKMINGKQFLEYTRNSFSKMSKNSLGYIEFHSIKAIHPAGMKVTVLPETDE